MIMPDRKSTLDRSRLMQTGMMPDFSVLRDQKSIFGSGVCSLIKGLFISDPDGGMRHFIDQVNLGCLIWGGNQITAIAVGGMWAGYTPGQ